MLKIKIFSIGKIKERWLEEAYQEYTKRLTPYIQLECYWAKNNEQLAEWCQKEHSYLCLDSHGQQFTSEEFSHFLFQQWELAGSRLTLVIGGAEGLTEAIKKKGILISLSTLTFTHQIARLILIEQIYRAIEIKRGSRYNRSNIKNC